jgi:hypothetical protein
MQTKVKILKEVSEILDNLLGDTEPFIDPEWDDETIKDEEPLFWCTRELNKYIDKEG